MSDRLRPESATASLTAVSAWAASGISAERVTLEKPTPLTATLHRFSHIRPFPSPGLVYRTCILGSSPLRKRGPRASDAGFVLDSAFAGMTGKDAPICDPPLTRRGGTAAT